MFESVKNGNQYLSMASYEESLACMIGEASPADAVTRSISEAVGAVLAEDLTAPISVPTFDNSAMDGFAFASSDVIAASCAKPVNLPIVGASIAGDTAGVSQLQPGLAAKIMTGAPVPEGADTILPVEFASWAHDKLSFYEAYPAGKHVRRVGEDVQAGAPVLKKSARLEGQHIPLLCALGLNKIKTYQRPRMAWVATGQEISDDFDVPLNPGHIYNSTGLYGAKSAADMGLDIAAKVTVRDTPQDFSGALDDALDSNVDVIISTGGVSAGQYDFVKPVLEDMGAQIFVHKARIKPGKPILFARLPDGTYFFGLPGNPISTALALRAFVYPFVRALSGLSAEPPKAGRLLETINTSQDRTVFLMATADVGEDATVLLRPQSKQQSFQTMPFADSNAWVISPEGTGALEAGSIIQWIPLRPGIF